MRLSNGWFTPLTLLLCLSLVSNSGAAQDPEKERGVELTGQTEEVTLGRLLLAVIGIDEYDHWQQLDNAVGDAVGWQAALVETAGFTVPIEPLLNKNATKPAIMSLIEDQLPQLIEPDDQLIVFFAGHGHTRVVQVGDLEVETGYLVPVEAPAGQAEQWSSYIRIDQFLRAVNELPARHVLVVLDACHSGFAMGSAIEKFRGVDEFQNELSRKVSRRVITSAQRDQLASDRGPLPGHSLFTGAFVDGLRWGRVDIDANGIVTSSEIGLFLQQSVGQATGSKQTPDFGAFGLDDRGELVISLQNQTFSALTARAHSALENGRHQEFAELTEQLAQNRPGSPETLYLLYRLGLLQGDVEGALLAIKVLEEGPVNPGVIPLGAEDLWDLKQQLSFWRQLLELPESAAGIKVEIVLESNPVARQPLGELDVHKVPPDTTFRLRVTNQSQEPRFVGLLLITELGRIKPFPLWSLTDAVKGIPAGETWESLPVQKRSAPGIEELRLIVTPQLVDQLVSPPDAKSRAGMGRLNIVEAQRHTIRLVSFPVTVP